MSGGPRLTVFGRQGAGKGTQCALLAERVGVPHISTGDIFRAAAASGTELGQKVKGIMERGELVSDEVLRDVVADRLAQADAADGWILDGFPRTSGQAADLDEIADPALDLAVNIEVAEDVVIERITSRRVCERGHMFVAGDPEIADGRCPKDGTAVTQRADDTEDGVRKRLAWYAEQTEPLLSRYAERNSLVTVDGVGTVDEVAERLATAVDGALDGRNS